MISAKIFKFAFRKKHSLPIVLTILPMKRITLFTLLFALLGVVAFAQNSQKGETQSQRPVFNCVDRHALTATNAVLNAEEELVTPPASAQVETWYTIEGALYVNTPSGVQDFISAVPTIKVAIDGSDIYIQGLAYYFRDGWIKGTLNGTTATFASGQLVGEDEYGPEYICGTNDTETLTDVVFNYNAEDGIMESQTTYILENNTATDLSPYAYWYKPSFSTKEPSKLVGIVWLSARIMDQGLAGWYDHHLPRRPVLRFLPRLPILWLRPVPPTRGCCLHLRCRGKQDDGRNG